MKSVFYLFIVTFFLASCGKPPSDSEIREKIIGTWNANSSTANFLKNGELETVRGTNKINAQWRVKDGIVIDTPISINGSEPSEAYAHESRFRVVSINDREMVCRVEQKRKTNTFTAYKQ